MTACYRVVDGFGFATSMMSSSTTVFGDLVMLQSIRIATKAQSLLDDVVASACLNKAANTRIRSIVKHTLTCPPPEHDTSSNFDVGTKPKIDQKR